MKAQPEYRVALLDDRTIDPQQWELQRRHQNGSFYLSYEYSQILRKQGCIPVYFHLLDNRQEIRGLALGYFRSHWTRRPLTSLCRSFEVDTSPIVSNEESAGLDAFARLIIEEVKRRGVSRITLGSEDSLVSPRDLTRLGFTPSYRIEFEMELNGNDEKILSRMSKKRRSTIRQRDRQGNCWIEEKNDEEGVRELISLQSSSRERRRKRGEDYAIGSAAAVRLIADNYLNKGLARLFLARIDGHPASGCLLHTFEKRAYYTMAGASPTGFQASAPSYLVWKVMRALRDGGTERLNLGGVPLDARDREHPSHGLYSFKKSFGGKEIQCTSWDNDRIGVRSVLAKLLEHAR